MSEIFLYEAQVNKLHGISSPLSISFDHE